MSGFRPVRFRHDDALTRVSWQEFERLIAEHFRQLGYQVEHTGTGDGTNRTDGGIDLKLRRDQETILVQCKHWTAFQVPHNAVHELIGVMHTQGATGAIVISSGEFTPAAVDAAAKFRHIRLIDGRAVRAMLGPIHEPVRIVPPPQLPPPSWKQVSRNRSNPAAPPARTSGRHTHVIAAITAAGVMAIALMTLYSFYIQEIQQAQLASIRATAATSASRVNLAPVPLPTIAPAHRASELSNINGRPAVVREPPASKHDVAEWAQQNAESMKILERTTPELR